MTYGVECRNSVKKSLNFLRLDLQHQYRTTAAYIDVAAVAHNFERLSEQLSTGKLMPVIKAQAYGHDALLVANALANKAEAFAVAILEEAIEIREQGISQPIVIMQGVYSIEAFITCFELGLLPVIHCKAQLNIYSDIPPAKRPDCWMKIDIGMHRLGFQGDEIPSAWQTLCELHSSKPVLCAHFSEADSSEQNVTSRQLQAFQYWQNQFDCDASLANSPAIAFRTDSHMLWNRAGIALYGISPNIHRPRADGIQPVMTLAAPVISIRKLQASEKVGYGGTWQANGPSTIATIAIGYADGYPRHAPNGTPVWINGQRCPIVGRVSMDMITVDITAIDNVVIGDMAELWGKNLAVEEIAEHCDTIAYELLARIGVRVPRLKLA